MDAIEFDHSANPASLSGAEPVIRELIAQFQPRTLLDVGCGTGTWLRVALDAGIDAHGIDGTVTSGLLAPVDRVRIVDLRSAWDLGRKFDLVLCFEVAEHLEAEYAERFIGALTRHADIIVFSAAIPRQIGQHHVNCQWPDYWCDLFARHGFGCDDQLRWQFWSDSRVEPWYRQNMLIATRGGANNPIRSVIHPDILGAIDGFHPGLRERIAAGSMPVGWYLKALIRKLCRHFR
jgi:hypothetical protein